MESANRLAERLHSHLTHFGGSPPASNRRGAQKLGLSGRLYLHHAKGSGGCDGGEGGGKAFKNFFGPFEITANTQLHFNEIYMSMSMAYCPRFLRFEFLLDFTAAQYSWQFGIAFV